MNQTPLLLQLRQQTDPLRQQLEDNFELELVDRLEDFEPAQQQQLSRKQNDRLGCAVRLLAVTPVRMQHPRRHAHE